MLGTGWVEGRLDARGPSCNTGCGDRWGERERAQEGGYTGSVLGVPQLRIPPPATGTPPLIQSGAYRGLGWVCPDLPRKAGGGGPA